MQQLSESWIDWLSRAVKIIDEREKITLHDLLKLRILFTAKWNVAAWKLSYFSWSVSCFLSSQRNSDGLELSTHPDPQHLMFAIDISTLTFAAAENKHLFLFQPHASTTPSCLLMQDTLESQWAIYHALCHTQTMHETGIQCFLYIH